MTIQELDTKVSKWADDLRGPAMGTIMGRVGIEARRLIFERIKDTGVNADGQRFSSPGYSGYSTKDMLVGCSTFRKKDCTAFFRGNSLEWRSIRKPGVKKPTKGNHNAKSDYYRLALLRGGYKKLREISNRPSAFIDFFWSGQMWQGVNVKLNQGENSSGIVTIGAIDQEARNKLNGNAKRFGPILKLSQKEINELSGYFVNQIKKVMNIQ